jgi:hypothetical protein
MLDVEENVPIIGSLSDTEIVLLLSKGNDDSNHESDFKSAENKIKEKKSMQYLIKAVNKAILGLDHRNIILKHKTGCL